MPNTTLWRFATRRSGVRASCRPPALSCQSAGETESGPSSPLAAIRRLSPVLIPALFALLACGSPVAPSDRVSFAVQVVGHISGRPLADEPVFLVREDVALPRPPMIRPTRTDATGVARWTVTPGHAYALIVRGVPHFQGVVVVNDSRWLLSLPE